MKSLSSLDNLLYLYKMHSIIQKDVGNIDIEHVTCLFLVRDVVPQVAHQNSNSLLRFISFANVSRAMFSVSVSMHSVLF